MRDAASLAFSSPRPGGPGMRTAIIKHKKPDGTTPPGFFYALQRLQNGAQGLSRVCIRRRTGGGHSCRAGGHSGGDPARGPLWHKGLKMRQSFLRRLGGRTSGFCVSCIVSLQKRESRLARAAGRRVGDVKRCAPRQQQQQPRQTRQQQDRTGGLILRCDPAAFTRHSR